MSPALWKLPPVFARKVRGLQEARARVAVKIHTFRAVFRREDRGEVVPRGEGVMNFLSTLARFLGPFLSREKKGHL